MRRIGRYYAFFMAILIIPCVLYAQGIHEAVKSGNIDEVHELVAADTSLINAVDDAGNTPLHIACGRGLTDMVRLLMDKGAKLDEVNNQGFTPLRLAIHTMNIEIVKMLLDRGAKADDVHPMFGSVMNQAFAATCQNNKGPELVRLLMDRGLALEAGQVDALGMTPLDWAVHFGNVEMATLALDQGAEVNLVSQRLGRTALISAVTKGNGELVDILLEHGADISPVDKNGNPAIYYAVDQGRTAILKALLANGAKVDFKEPHYGRSLLHIAAIKGFRDIAEDLVNRGAAIDAMDESGKTPLFYAVGYGNQSVADYLIGQGAKAQVSDGEPSSTDSDLDTGGAVIRYLNHRGWAVETKDHMLVFDAEEFEVRRSDDPGLANGFLTPGELNDQNVVAVYSCYHGLPGEPAFIHTLSDSLKKISYVHLVDDAWRGSPNTIYLKSGADTSIAGINLQTIDIASYMPMLAYMCHVTGLNIFYQAFGTDDSAKLAGDYESLSQYVDTVDIAFLPLPEPDQEMPDIRMFLERFPTRAVVLVDSNRREFMYPDAARRIAEWGFSAKVLCAENPGDMFEL